MEPRSAVVRRHYELDNSEMHSIYLDWFVCSIFEPISIYKWSFVFEQQTNHIYVYTYHICIVIYHIYIYIACRQLVYQEYHFSLLQLVFA